MSNVQARQHPVLFLNSSFMFHVFCHLSWSQVYDADWERDPPRRSSRLVSGLLSGWREWSQGSEGYPAWEQAWPYLQHRQVIHSKSAHVDSTNWTSVFNVVQYRGSRSGLNPAYRTQGHERKGSLTVLWKTSGLFCSKHFKSWHLHINLFFYSI